MYSRKIALILVGLFFQATVPKAFGEPTRPLQPIPIANPPNSKYTDPWVLTKGSTDDLDGTLGDSDRFSSSSYGRGVGWTAPARPPSLVNSPSDNKKASPITCHPVIISTGEKIVEENDFQDFSLSLLTQNRTYRSLFQSSRLARLFGDRWYSSFDFPQIEFSSSCSYRDGYSAFGCLPDYVNVSMPDGSTHQYVYGFPYYFPAGFPGGDSVLGYMQIYATNKYRVVIGQRTYNYDPVSKNLMSIEENGATLYSFGYTNVSSQYSYLQLTSVTARNGKTLNFHWTGTRVTSVTDASGAVWNYSYDAKGNLVRVTPPLGTSNGVKEYLYEDPNDSGLLTGIKVDGIRKTSYSYYANGQVAHSGYDNNEEYENFVYSTSPLFTRVTNQRGQVTQYNFEQKGNFKRLVSVARNSTSSCGASSAAQTYDANGYVNSETDWNGNTTTSTYFYGGLLDTRVSAANGPNPITEKDTWDGIRLVSRTWRNSAGQDFRKITYEYSAGGLASGLVSAVVTQDLRTNATSRADVGYTFQNNNVLGTLSITQHLPTGDAVTTARYDINGNLISVTNALNQTFTYSNFTGLGRPGRMTDPNGVITDYTYDTSGNLLVKNVSGRKISYTYDGNRNITSIVYPNGQSSSFTYNAAGRLTGIGNALSEFVTLPLSPTDISNNIHTSHIPRNTLSWDGTAITAIPAGEIVKTVQDDSLGRSWYVSGTNGQQIGYTYDANGNVKTITDAQKHATLFDYDAYDRVLKKTLSDGGAIVYKYDADGNLQSITDPRGLLTSYTYDSFGRVLTVSSPDTQLSTYNYDSFGRLLSETKSDGSVITYTWDALGRIRSRAHNNIIQYYNYDEGLYGIGRLTSFSDGTGQTQYSYNDVGQLLSQTNIVFGKVFHTSWEYDSVGQLISMAYPTGVVLHYNYDQYGRLSSVRSINWLHN